MGLCYKQVSTPTAHSTGPGVPLWPVTLTWAGVMGGRLCQHQCVGELFQFGWPCTPRSLKTSVKTGLWMGIENMGFRSRGELV